jgi:dephospho-CoA kinase
LIIGLTGGIGSGKSAAANCFAHLGAVIVDTDAIAHTLTAPDGLAIPAIRAAFGDAIIRADGALDRDAMRALVFTDHTARQRLEAILHPMIAAESERQCATATSPYVIYAVPLLIESAHARERCARICVVDCAVETQVLRVKARNNLAEALIRAIIAAQVSREARLAAADDVIDNNGEFAALAPQVARLHDRYVNLAGQCG